MKKTFTTRLLAIVLCVAMLATVTPIFASAETVITEVTITDADITPVLGEKMIDHTGYTLPEGAPYQRYNSGQNGWVANHPDGDGIFTEGFTYYRYIALKAADGYLFDENTVITVNGAVYEGTLNVNWFIYENGKWFYFVMPGVTLSEEQITAINITDADITPIIGDEAGDHLAYTLPENCHFTVDEHYWYMEGVGSITNPTVFAEGFEYDTTFELYPEDGYVFADDLTITINGTDTVIDWANTEIYNDYCYVWTKPTEAVEPIVIDTIEINGFCDAVVGGKAGDFIRLTLPEDAPYHFDAGDPRWYNDTDDVGMDYYDAFEAGKSYSLGGWLIADKGYVFAENPTILLNGGEVAFDESFTKRDDTDTSCFYVWGKSKEAVEKTADIEITEVTITDADITPILGEKKNDHLAYTLPEGAPYYKYNSGANNWQSSPSESGDTFVEGVTYSRFISLEAADGYLFDENTVITVNGTLFEGKFNVFWWVMDGGKYLTILMPGVKLSKKQITAINITDVDLLPIIGDKTNDHIDYTFPENCHFTATEHGWYDKTDETWVDGADDTFVAGHTYQVGWWLDADEGYTFAEDPTITINGEENINWGATHINEYNSMLFYVWSAPVEAVEKPEAE